MLIFHLNSKLKDNVPKNLIEIIYYLFKVNNYYQQLPDHKFFKQSGWQFIFIPQRDNDTDETHLSLRKDEGYYYLCIRHAITDKGKTDLFIDWIMQYLDKKPGEYLGFYKDVTSNTKHEIYMK